ncbi:MULTISPECIES: hypothetical protein [unclassified Mucilaginibacter]|uniref:hypothetical protein n=1 Tax=unclassified Mucilaginibacter TaxID=2617802 RepID=UPI0009671D05|nr:MULTISPECIES: hypothetical protein [unclassified Mucilaginibacter]OJW14845.1 MAG: hypothetical protein BGO48_11740 [Mucilaginibacter sp. 44-25]PLW89499.1 MAG: hypothetical protein C0154_11380 [Mucilaginibacter sp.]PMP65484.1 MAG: hypothetical protein C0191_03585 [Mucilaginibacter sp.]HEK22227.1 hypothetical protein [Bacteroidota bacterium]
MSTTELKEEIQKAIEQIPESAPENLLQDVLGYIQDVNAKIAQKAKYDQYFKEILAEDEEVFRKLAQ